MDEKQNKRKNRECVFMLFIESYSFNKLLLDYQLLYIEKVH